MKALIKDIVKDRLNEVTDLQERIRTSFEVNEISKETAVSMLTELILILEDLRKNVMYQE